MNEQTSALAKEQNYSKMALEHARITAHGGKDQPDLPIIRPETAEWRAWRAYFIGHLGFEPVIMKLIRQDRYQSMTVPADLPEQFDGSYSPGEAPRRA